MKTLVPRLSVLATASVIAGLTLMPVSVSAGGQRAGGHPAGRSSGGSGQGSGGGGQGSGGGAQPRSGGGERAAPTRGDGGAKTGGSTGGGSGRAPTTRTATAGGDRGSTGTDSGTPSQRTSEGKPVAGHAVPRSDGSRGGGTTIIIPGGYYGGYLPWGYAGLGLAGYYGGYYDGYGSGYGYPSYSSSDEDGALRLKVKPRDASVFVDGYFAGQVDQFDGVFQRLHVEPGPHRIEISADGYETLSFEIRAERDRTVTYTGALNRVQ